MTRIVLRRAWTGVYVSSCFYLLLRAQLQDSVLPVCNFEYNH